MRTTSAAADAAIAAGQVTLHGAVRIQVPTSIAASGSVRWWGGWGFLNLDAGLGSEDYVGVGDHGLVRATGGALGGASQATVLELSGVDPDILLAVELGGLRRAPVVIWRLEFDGSNSTMLDACVHKRGRVATAVRAGVIGGAETIRIEVEGAASGLGRASGRMRSDADQRMINSGDPGLRSVGFAATKTLYFGGKAPARAGVALPNTAGRYPGSGGGSVNDQLSSALDAFF